MYARTVSDIYDYEYTYTNTNINVNLCVHIYRIHNMQKRRVWYNHQEISVLIVKLQIYISDFRRRNG